MMLIFMEKLESRFLMSMAPTAGPLAEGVGAQPLKVIVINWKGMETRVVKGEWLVNLEIPEPVYINGMRQRAQLPTPEDEAAMQAALDELGMGVRFEKYLGVCYCFKVTVQGNRDYSELLPAFKALEKFRSIEPNFYGSGGGGFDGSDMILPDPTPKPITVTEPEIDEVIVSDTASASLVTDEAEAPVEQEVAMPVYALNGTADDVVTTATAGNVASTFFFTGDNTLDLLGKVDSLLT
jgi:hypothetical protein